MPSTLTKQQQESREQDLVEGTLRPSTLIAQAFTASGRASTQEETVVAFLFDDLYTLKGAIQSLKAQEEGVDLNTYRARIRERFVGPKYA